MRAYFSQREPATRRVVHTACLPLPTTLHGCDKTSDRPTPQARSPDENGGRGARAEGARGSTGARRRRPDQASDVGRRSVLSGGEGQAHRRHLARITRGAPVAETSAGRSADARSGADTWEPKFKVLKEQTEHHHEEEEENLFPKVRKALDTAELEDLGQRMLAMQQQLQRAGDPREAVVEQTDEATPLK